MSRSRRLASALALAVATVACGHPELPSLGDVPAFALTERSEQPFGDADVRGHVWIADFIFTRCPDVCPLLTKRLAEVQAALAASSAAVRLVSITVDPGHDTPAVLRDYATAHGAGPNWMFLTGPRDQIGRLLTDGFHVAYGDDGPATGPLTHSDRFVLVDGRLRIRGYYHGNDPDDLRRLIADATTLATSPDA